MTNLLSEKSPVRGVKKVTASKKGKENARPKRNGRGGAVTVP